MAANAPPSVTVDEGGEIVLNRFYDFLAKFTSSAEGTTDGTDGVQLYRDYLAQIAAMVENEKNTVYVDVQHVFAVSETKRHVVSVFLAETFSRRSAMLCTNIERHRPQPCPSYELTTNALAGVHYPWLHLFDFLTTLGDEAVFAWGHACQVRERAACLETARLTGIVTRAPTAGLHNTRFDATVTLVQPAPRVRLLLTNHVSCTNLELLPS